MDSNELQTFIQDVRDDLNNLDSLIDYYDFLGHHNIRTIVFNPEDESSFFEAKNNNCSTGSLKRSSTKRPLIFSHSCFSDKSNDVE